ncbi:hypothetical protein C1T20_13175 [Paenibacillus polymyxa]|nr:hypothetical protein C1T20_13175 [Paenibacillus polymyxa]
MSEQTKEKNPRMTKSQRTTQILLLTQNASWYKEELEEYILKVRPNFNDILWISLHCFNSVAMKERHGCK